jgi:ribosomal protein S2
MSQRPALTIIPDIINNDMILREVVIKNIPVIGLVNSNESTKISYPVFGNSDSIQVVHFFCNFLALLLAKSFIQQEYKQASHRLFHRTRAFFNVKKKKTEESSINIFSKKYIRVQTQLFPTVSKGVINKR